MNNEYEITRNAKTGKPYLYKSGDIYGYLMLTGKAFVKKRHYEVEAICKCGVVKWYNFTNVRKGTTSSCGCYFLERVTTHGMTHHPLYMSWDAMISRCGNPNTIKYNDYGGRGIEVCEEWKNSFISFRDWSFENGWQIGLTIDRKDTNGNYEPSNCRWANDFVQSRNKRTNINLEAFGEIKCLQDWVQDDRCSINRNSVMKRISNGWSIEDAISKPSTTWNKDYVYNR